MKKLSSKSTFFHKRIFPVIWFGFIGLFILVPLFAHQKDNGPPFVFIIFPLFMAGLGYFIMKKMVWDLVDEAYDEGDTLLFKNGDKQERVSIRDIKNISYSVLSNPPRVTISVRRNTVFSSEISFTPQVGFIPFKKNSDIEELVDRVDRARG